MRTGTLQTIDSDTLPDARARLGISGWLEIVLLACFAALLTAATDIFPAFPALSTIPLAFLALRHGSSPGVLGGLIWILAYSLIQRTLQQTPDPLSLDNLGPLLVILLCGYASDHWRELRVSSLSVQHHQDHTLTALTHEHHLLQLSHARLEQRVIGGVETLRESLEQLHKSMCRRAERELPLARQAADLLTLFDSLTWIQSAAIYMVRLDGRFLTTASAEFGHPPPLEAEDALVMEAITQGRVLAVSDSGFEKANAGVLIAAPIVDNEQLVRAVVCVYKVPFLSFNTENLTLLAVLAAHLGHMISTAEKAATASEHEQFVHTLRRACRDASAFALPATLAQWTFKQSQTAQKTAQFLQDNIRDLDHLYIENNAGLERLTLLCTLTDAKQYELLVGRIAQLLDTRFAIKLEAQTTRQRVHAISAKDTPESLLKLMSIKRRG